MKNKKLKKTTYNTGRKEHLNFNGQIALVLCLACPTILVSVLFIFITEKRYDLIQWWWVASLLLTPMMYRNHERVASPDMDLRRGGFLGAYWRLYSKNVRHRGICSHPLLLGSPLRFAIAYAFPLLALVVTFNWQLIGESHSTLYIVSNLTMPESVCWFIAWWFAVCAFSDFSHLMCDRMFNPAKFLILGDP
jgi:uncharacterized metal-binding protein